MKSSTAVLESLEPRSLFSAPYDFAGVGVRFGPEPLVFVTEGVIDADDALTGSTTFADAAGAGAPQPLDWTRLDRGPGGTFTFGTRDGFNAYHSQSGAQFIRDERFAMGSFVGRDVDGAARDYLVLAQKESPPRPLEEFEPLNTLLQFTRVMPDGSLQTSQLHLIASGPYGGLPFFEFRYLLPEGTVSTFEQATAYENGRFTFDPGEYLFVTGLFRPALFADLNADDGIVGVAAGAQALSTGIPNGAYRGSVIITDPRVAPHFGIDPADVGADGATADVVIELRLVSLSGNESINHFAVYRQSEYDLGQRTPLAAGTWATSYLLVNPGNPVQTYALRTADDSQIVFRPGTGHVLFLHQFHPAPDDPDQTIRAGLFGVFNHAEARPGEETQTDVTLDDNRRPIVYIGIVEDRDNDTEQIYTFDAIDEVGGESVVSNIITWTQPAGWGQVLFIAGVSASGDLQLWQYNRTLGWVYWNLSEAFPDSRPINPNLFATTTSFEWNHAPLPDQFLAAFDADGNLQVFHQVHTHLFDPDQAWAFIDAIAPGLDGAGAIPASLTSLSGFSSSWDAVHFAGLDDQGDIWSVWWAPGMQRWRVDNISDDAGAMPIVGGLSAIRTDWDAFHLSGVDANGHLVVTWWAPASSDWASDDLTEVAGAPLLNPGTVASHFTQEYRNIVIVGEDARGDARIIWWGIDRGWHVNTIAARALNPDFPVTPWTFTSANWSTGITQSLRGKNADNELVRFRWTNYGPDLWLFESLADMSLPYNN